VLLAVLPKLPLIKVEFADFMPLPICYIPLPWDWPGFPGRLIFAKAFFKLLSPCIFILMLDPSSESESESFLKSIFLNSSLWCWARSSKNSYSVVVICWFYQSMTFRTGVHGPFSLYIQVAWQVHSPPYIFGKLQRGMQAVNSSGADSPVIWTFAIFLTPIKGLIS